MDAKQIELAVAKYFGMNGMQNRNLIIPNFKGFWIHECDLLIVTPSRWAYEVEIKCSLQDLKADLQKKHHHGNEGIIKGLYFAMPIDIYEKGKEFIPIHAGILITSEYSFGREGQYCSKIKQFIKDDYARKLTEVEYLHLGRILCQRLWKLKRDINETTP
jgi:hypothetical protein